MGSGDGMLRLIALLLAAAPEAPSADWHVHVALAIDATGHAMDCKVVESDAPAELQQKTCEIFRSKGAFKPKLDDAGQPVASTYETTARFRIPS